MKNMIALRRKLAFVAVFVFVFGISLGQVNTAEAKQRLAVTFQKSPVAPGCWGGGGFANGAPVNVVAKLNATRDAGLVTHVVNFQFSFTPVGTIYMTIP